jgi:hypothetical protein
MLYRLHMGMCVLLILWGIGTGIGAAIVAVGRSEGHHWSSGLVWVLVTMAISALLLGFIGLALQRSVVQPRRQRDRHSDF